MHITAISRFALLPVLAIVVAVALLALSASDSDTTPVQADGFDGIPEFDADYDIRLCNVLGASFGGPPILQGDGTIPSENCAQDGTPSGNPDVATFFDVPNGHHNFAQDYFITSLAGFTLTDHNTIPVGTAMAGLESTIKLGLAANPCTNTIVPEFIFWNGEAKRPKAPNTAVAAAEGDLGVALTAMAADEKFNDGVIVNGVFNPGEAVYRDLDASNTVTAGDIRVRHQAINSGVVAGGDGDITNALTAFAANVKKTGGAVAINPDTNLYRDNDTDNTVSIGDTRLTGHLIFNGQVEGTDNRFITLANEVPSNPTSATGRDNDAFAGKADSTANVVTRYPDMSLRFFDPDGDGFDTDGNAATLHDQPVQPVARYAALTQVPSGNDWQLLQIFTFNSSDLRDAFSRNTGTWKHPLAKLGSTATQGQVSVTLLNDPTATAVSINPISDFCTSLGTKATLLGMVDTTGNDVGDTARITAPASNGARMAQVRTQSLRDADNDGLDNPFDTCQWIPNTPDESPLYPAVPGDGVGNDGNGPDDDMLDSVCDPTPLVNTNFADHDGDGYLNNQDLCPLNAVASPALQLDSETSVSRNAAAPDGGPHSDSIGDACDGVVHANFNPSGLGNPLVANGGYFNEIFTDSVCIGLTDADGDGWCSTASNGAAADPDDNDPDVHPGGTEVRLPSTADADGDDNQSGKVYTTADDSQEWAVGTDPNHACREINGHDTWPPDINIDGNANILDIVLLTPPVFNKAPPDPNYVVRKDLNANGSINILDIVLLTPPVFNKNCTQ